MSHSLARRAFSETLGSFLLSATVIGSGILASRFTDDTAVALLGNTAATGAILFVLISALGPISGAHFNPAITLVMTMRRKLSAGDALAYVTTQVAGCIFGAWLAHYMFELPVLQTATNVRGGLPQIVSEGAATFALVFASLFVSKLSPQAVAAAVALMITAGYWWTASTSFANPAITIARALSDTFAGVRPVDVLGFIVGQLAGALLAWVTSLALLSKEAQA